MRQKLKILSDLRTWLDDAAKIIAYDDEDPEHWDTPVLYLLEALENESERNEGDEMAYEKMLNKIRDALSNQLKDRTWGY